jgi:GNAT superfamily N-acetyltransferase
VTGYFDAAPRPLTASDVEPVRNLVWGALGVTPYVDRTIELLSAAEHGEPESRALVIERDGTVAALALYGPVAGATDTWRVAMVLVAQQVDLREVGRAILEAVVDNARLGGARLLVAELPADPVLGRSLSLLRANGFSQEARVPDFFREGVALLFLRRAI